MKLTIIFLLLLGCYSETYTTPILCYHNISSTMRNILNTTPNEFEKQVKYFYDNGYTTILSKDIKNRDINKKVIMITFDDGKESIYTYALPIMKRYNFKGIVFIITGNIGKHKFMNESQICSLIEKGWEIGY